MIVKYLADLFGEDNVSVFFRENASYPVYFRNYAFSFIEIFRCKYVFVELNDNADIKTYLMQKAKIESIIGYPPVLVLKESNSVLRNCLIKNKVMFIEEGKQLFMPELGVVLENRNDKTNFEAIERFTPQIQLCALFFLYSEIKYYPASQIRTKTRMNDMAVSRGLNALVKLDLISFTRNGNRQYYILKTSKKDFWKKCRKYMISPVRSSVLIDKRFLPSGAVKSGYTALSDYSMLLDDRIPTYAVSKENCLSLRNKYVLMFENAFHGADYANVQIWKYDPTVFAEKNKADILSLYLSLESERDERARSVLEKLKEKVLNE